MKDPLGFFTDEKLAAEVAPSTELSDKPREFRADPESLDPGERAMAGLSAAAGSFASRATPFVTRMLGGALYDRMGDEWILPAVQDVKTIAEAQAKLSLRTPAKPTKVLGLVDIKPAPRPPIPKVAPMDLLLGRDPELISKISPIVRLGEIQKTVDSFIQKHKLPQKGVRIDLQSGLLSSMGGGSYSPLTGRVVIPRIGKELALHELGHAADYTGSRLGKLRGRLEPAVRRSVMAALPIAFAAGDKIKEIIPGTIDDKAIEFMQDNAPGIMAATLAATEVIPEARASYLAVKHVAEKEGPVAARAALKKLLPFWGTYILGAIPAVVGMALARKYMRHAREEKEDVGRAALGELEKQGGFFGHFLKDTGYAASQLGKGTVELLRKPDLMKSVAHSAKEIGTSPEFIWGAVGAAVPAALGALYMYGTPGGQAIREPLNEAQRQALLQHGKKESLFVRERDESWKERHPLRFAGLVAAGAALSGGILSKFWSDMSRVI